MQSSKLPQRLSWDMASTLWATILGPLVANPVLQGIILQNVELSAGVNVINHKLGRKLQGWYPVRVRAAAIFFDTQDTNRFPELTLQLTSSADCVVDIYCF